MILKPIPRFLVERGEWAEADREWKGRLGALASDRIDQTDKKIIGLIQGDIPLHPEPFAVMARTIGISEAEFISRVEDLKKRGVIRRFGATLRHQEAGYRSNAMVAWSVPEERLEEVGEALARRREVTHCYQRNPQGDWPYNLYTMIHGSSREECRKIAEKMSESVGIKEYRLLFSEKEFKKTSMAYF
jgi:siroheme decarboxylase